MTKQPNHETLDEWTTRTGDVPWIDKRIQYQVDYERSLSRCKVCGHAFDLGELVHVAWDDYESYCARCLNQGSVDTVGHTRSVEAGAVDEKVLRCYKELGLPYVDLREITESKER